ncbi:MAG: ATP synthase F1 subunit epsilon [Elusimicrobia bacterium RIFCSPLOWO2_01_FULL_54_10]|nr:MAG: ATP synthase F1 subunit epsilon [Elusimicrobia bacterium RIFCSPLOWO2_01_FULL_54_10]
MLDLEVITPERLAFSEQADSITIPALEGEIGILPGHAPLLVQLATGELRIQSGDRTEFFAVSGGFVEVLRNRVHVFAETAEMQGEISAERARQAAEKARKDMQKAASPADLEQAQAALRRALLRLRIAEGMSRRRSK